MATTMLTQGDQNGCSSKTEMTVRMGCEYATKVQQKISGCFRSIDGAYIFCRIRGYLLSCRKHEINATEALNLLFEGSFPKFITELM